MVSVCNGKYQGARKDKKRVRKAEQKFFPFITEW